MGILLILLRLLVVDSGVQFFKVFLRLLNLAQPVLPNTDANTECDHDEPEEDNQDGANDHLD